LIDKLQLVIDNSWLFSKYKLQQAVYGIFIIDGFVKSLKNVMPAK